MGNIDKPELQNKEREPARPPGSQQKIWGKVVQVSTIAWTTIATIAVGVFLGQWLDKRLGTQPVFIILLSILGVISAIRFLFDFSRKI